MYHYDAAETKGVPAKRMIYALRKNTVLVRFICAQILLSTNASFASLISCFEPSAATPLEFLCSLRRASLRFRRPDDGHAQAYALMTDFIVTFAQSPTSFISMPYDSPSKPATTRRASGETAFGISLIFRAKGTIFHGGHFRYNFDSRDAQKWPHIGASIAGERSLF